MNTQAAVQAFLNNRHSLNRRRQTINWYTGMLRNFVDFCPELPMEPEPIEEFMAQVVPDEHYETRHGYYRAIKALYHFTCKRHRLSNPMDMIDPPTRRRRVRPTLDAKQMMNVLAQADSERDKAIISLLIDSGPRADELASLKSNCIFEDFIMVTGKTGEREVPISEETRRLLLNLISNISNNSSSNNYVFLGERGRLTRSGIYRIVKQCMIKSGISGPKLGPHRLRHAFGRSYVANGGDIRSLQQILGHTNISTTEIYVELSREEICAKHHQFTPLRSVHAAAQVIMWKDEALKEAEEIFEVNK